MRNYYIFSSGDLKRRENTVFFEDLGRRNCFIPIETIDQIFVFGEVNFNNKFLNYICQKGICLHLFNYYGYYSGSFYPRNTNLSGSLVIKQAEHYLDSKKRLCLAKAFVEAAIHNIRRNLQKKGYSFEEEKIKESEQQLGNAMSIDQLMGIEAQVRRIYYGCFPSITGWTFGERSIRPPGNPLNALLSFGNSLVYTAVLREIYVTPLSPVISYLHQPSERRFSLALDIAEIFKPILCDRLIFSLINLKQLTELDFEESLEGIYLKERGREVFVKEFDKLLETTIVHRKLKKRIKYKTLMKLELYKLIKHILGEKVYKPLKVWW